LLNRVPAYSIPQRTLAGACPLVRRKTGEMVTKLPESNQERGNRRGCYLLIAAILLSLLAFGLLSRGSGDRQQANEVTGGAALGG
jgi:hypothetical protein